MPEAHSEKLTRLTSAPQRKGHARMQPWYSGIIFVFIFLLHLPLLRLPYFWDEAGTTFPPRAISCFTGSLIPHSTLSNAHPPLVMAWLALWWKMVGYTPLVTRTAMLVLAAFSLLGVFRLAERVANTRVAVAAHALHGSLSRIFSRKAPSHKWT